MNYIDSPVIVENIETLQLVHMNRAAIDMLKIKDNFDNSDTPFSEFITEKETLQTLHTHIKEDLFKYEKSEGTMYLRTQEDIFIEAHFCCVWEDKNNNLISYIFKKATEVVNESSLSFHELAEHLPSGIVVMDVGNKLAITYANAEHYKILGVDENQKDADRTWLLKDFIFDEDLDWVLSEIHLNLAMNQDVDVEFRMKMHDGSAKWVRLFGRSKTSSTGEKLFYSSLKDLSQRKYLHDKLHMERVLFHKITELTDETIFRLDLKTDIIQFLGKATAILGDVKVFDNYPDSVMHIYQIHEDDMEMHNLMIHNFQQGIVQPVEMRYRLGKDDYEWYRTTYSFIRNSFDEPISVIGKMTNVHALKLLEEQAKTDLLTNLHNKMTTESETDKLFQYRPDKSHALLIVDIDNFKAVNDNLGHHFGDVVLKGIAEDIRTCFRKNDVIGRIGGDEFVVVMRDVSDTAIIIEKARLLCSVLNKVFTEGETQIEVSASVGISMFPTDGETYEELYKKSDIALYEIKHSTKNGYRQYHRDLHDNQNEVAQNDVGDYRRKPILVNNAVATAIMNLLYVSTDFQTIVSSVLECIGNIYKVDHCYILETSDGKTTCNDGYQWKNPNASLDDLQKLDTQTITNAFQGTNTDGVFCINHTNQIEDEMMVHLLQKENMNTLFVVDMMKDTDKKVLLAIDDSKVNRIFSKEELVTLLHISRLIFTAINHHNTLARLNEK